MAESIFLFAKMLLGRFEPAEDGKRTRNFLDSWDFSFGVATNPLDEEKELAVCGEGRSERCNLASEAQPRC